MKDIYPQCLIAAQFFKKSSDNTRGSNATVLTYVALTWKKISYNCESFTFKKRKNTDEIKVYIIASLEKKFINIKACVANCKLDTQTNLQN